ncbi:exoglucanase/xylanase-like [Gossypium australe]|uniref:Exoglucanase/xylanase-like n=1 Tax=Gossypium australe TaxID=47621 RepID=A0A5B6V8W1_9ROSI|nr:exoglucanase/xylanase-like [Gossypium australe]
MKHSPVFGGFWAFFILLSGSLVASYGSLSFSTFGLTVQNILMGFSENLNGPLYDFTAYTECKAQPEEPLYQGGILKGEPPIMRPAIIGETATGFYTPAFLLKNLTLGNFYCFSS